MDRYALRIHTMAAKLFILLALVIWAAEGSLTNTTQQIESSYTNPVAMGLPDPFILRDDSKYYAYGTNAPGEGFKVLVSDDLVHWTDGGFVFRKTKTSWGREHFWAPEVIKHQDAFFLFYSSCGPVKGDRLSHRISVARSDSPLGPFTDLKAPLLDIGKAVIDAHPFIDTDGSAYLYFALDKSEHPQSELHVIKLSDDLRSTVGDSFFCTKPDAAWEGREWNEAPFVFRFKDQYIMMYSARGFFDPNYSVGYSIAASPIGPWTKSARNPILKRTSQTSGPGHNSVIASPDGTELFCAYHIHRNLEGGHLRDLAIDRMKVYQDESGEVIVEVNGPTRSPQPMPSGTGVK